jgi:hypothetical protein
MQVTATHIQWKYTSDVTWTNLIALIDIKGDKGDTGSVDNINGLTMTKIITPAIPEIGKVILYFKADGKMYFIDNSTGVEKQVGGAGDFLVTQVFS